MSMSKTKPDRMNLVDDSEVSEATSANGTEPDDPLAIAYAEQRSLLGQLTKAEAEHKRLVSEGGKRVRALEKAVMEATKRVHALSTEVEN